MASKKSFSRLREKDYTKDGVYYHKCGTPLFKFDENTTILNARVWCKYCTEEVMVTNFVMGRQRG